MDARLVTIVVTDRNRYIQPKRSYRRLPANTHTSADAVGFIKIIKRSPTVDKESRTPAIQKPVVVFQAEHFQVTPTDRDILKIAR